MSHHESKDMTKVTVIGLIDIRKTLQPSICMPANTNQLCQLVQSCLEDEDFLVYARVLLVILINITPESTTVQAS